MTPLQWDFQETAKAFVAAQHQCNKIVTRTALSDDDESSGLIELDNWVLEKRRGSLPAGIEGDVYLVHPPLLIPSRTLQDEKDDTIVDVEEVAEEFNIEMIEEIDDSCIDQIPEAEISTCDYTEWTFSIVFHDIWRVPTLYFTCSQTDGTPLCRHQVLDILLNQQNKLHSKLENEQTWSEEELWEFVSQEEHPITGKPSYFLHPCRTADRMELLLMVQNNDSKNYTMKESSACPLLSWVSMILPTVGCRISPEVFCQMSKSMAGL